LRLARADQIADHDEPSGNADPARQRVGAACQASDALDKRQPGAHRALSVVLMCSRVAEINEPAVAHIFRDIAPEAGDHLGDCLVIGAEHLAQILGIEAGG
jgi:hypothetical protein